MRGRTACDGRTAVACRSCVRGLDRVGDDGGELEAEIWVEVFPPLPCEAGVVVAYDGGTITW